MVQKHRILTEIGVDKKVVVELKQDYDLLEILSLKFTQSEIYSSMCADYGVVCGRISVNNGYGIPNARVSIFIPLTQEDAEDPVVSKLYPYTDIEVKSEEGYRYNLLPKRKQHGGHEPTGTFPDQSDILTREEVLEVYEKYYKYTVKTNNAGDFMIWGVPTGTHTIHVDVDLSDIGPFSLRPYDFMRLGHGVDDFKSTYAFKSSQDIDNLPQITTFNRTIEVYPFWGNEDLCEIGITRSDFDLASKGVKIEPKAFIIGGTYSDSGKNSVNKNCAIRDGVGRKCSLVTKSGTIEAVRFTTHKDVANRPILEYCELNEDIPDDGAFVVPVLMNMDYVFTNEFGELEYTNNPNKGIPTSACYRFRFSLNNEGNERTRRTASYLVPNIREYSNDVRKSYSFSNDYANYPMQAMADILYSEEGSYYPKDYFYRVTYNKVYTVSSFQSLFYSKDTLKKKDFLGLKELVPTEEEDCSGEVVTPPVNFGVKNHTFTLLIAEVLLFFEHLINMALMVSSNTIVKVFFQLADALDYNVIAKVHKKVKKMAFRLMERGQRRLYLITYPECEECNGDNDNGVPITEKDASEFCEVGAFSGTSYIGGGKFTGSYSGSSWTVAHNLNESYPEVTVYNDRNEQVFPSTIAHQDNNTVIVGFGSISVTGTVTVRGTNGSKVVDVSNFTFSLSGDGLCPQTAKPISSVIDLLNRQAEYMVKIGSDLYALSVPSGAGDEDFNYFYQIDNQVYFNDSEGAFNVQSNAGVLNATLVDVSASVTPIEDFIALESGCSLYDVPYDESLIYGYYLGEGVSRQFKKTITKDELANVTAVLTSNRDEEGLIAQWGSERYEKITLSGYSEFSNGVYYFVPGNQSHGVVIKTLVEYRRRKRMGKLFCGGIVNYSFVDNWLSGSLYFFQFKEKKKKFCKNLITYNNVEKKFYYRSSPFDPYTNKFGVRNSANNHNDLGRPTTMVDLGPRDEFIKEICVDPTLDPNSSVVRAIGPTSYQDFGELMAFAINYRMDVGDANYELDNFFDNTGATNMKNVLDGDLLQLISINNEVGIAEFDLQDPRYLGYSPQILDPEVFPEVFKVPGSFGQKWGATPITLALDNDGQKVRSSLNEGTHIGYDGKKVQGRLTESSQPVPFFLWDKKGEGFGGSLVRSDNQFWDYNEVQLQPLQGMTYGYKISGEGNDSSDKYLLLPMTYNFNGLVIEGNVTTDVYYDAISTVDDHESYDSQYPGFVYLYVTVGNENVPMEGIMYTRYGAAGQWNAVPWNNNIDFVIRKTEDYYGRKQILSTPFQFYFGLRNGKTGVDKFIDLFGPEGAFNSAE